MLVCAAHVLYSVQVHLEACFCCLGSFERRSTLNFKMKHSFPKLAVLSIWCACFV